MSIKVNIKSTSTQSEQKDFNMDTPPGAPLKVKFRMEIEKLREMTFRNKLEHIWEYYKFHIIAIVVFLIFIGSIINTVWINPPAETALTISWHSGLTFDDQLEELRHALEEKVLDDSKNERIDIVNFLGLEEDPMANMANIQRLAAMVAAGVIDIFVLNTAQFEEFTGTGYLQPMDTVLNEIREIDSALYSRIEDKIIYAPFSIDAETTDERIMGIEFSNTPLLTELRFFEQERYLGISVTAGNIENAARTIIALFE